MQKSTPLSVNMQCIKRLQLFCLHVYQECAKAHYGMCQRRKTCYSQRGHFNTRDANMAAWDKKGTKNAWIKNLRYVSSLTQDMVEKWANKTSRISRSKQQKGYSNFLEGYMYMKSQVSAYC